MDDQEIVSTVVSAIENAQEPSMIYVGVGLLAMKKSTLKTVKKLSKKYKNVTFSYDKQKHNDVSTLGVGKGRMRAQKLYRDQDYFLQVDSHTYFDKGWDLKLLELFEEACSLIGDDNLVITCIPGVYTNTPNFIPVLELAEVRYASYYKQQLFIESVPRWNDWHLSVQRPNLPKLIPSVKANSAMLFGNKKFAIDTGINEDAFFYDEEVVYSINLVGRGFALVFPNIEDFPIYHLDSEYITSGHDRYFFLDYLDSELAEVTNDLVKKAYLGFLDDPKNAKSIQAYSEYAKIDLRSGFLLDEQPYIPENFRI
jgi:hypothetical protein